MMETPMRHKLVALLILASCFPAMAEPVGVNMLPAQGSAAVVSGRARVERAAQGTYINIEGIRGLGAVAGFVAFGNEPTFPGLHDLDGRHVEIVGVVIRDGRAVIMLTAPDQLRVKS